MKRWAAGASAAAVLLVVGFAIDAARPSPTVSGRPPEAFIVEVTAADARPDIQVTVLPEFRRALSVQASISGLVTEVRARPGQRVMPGDVVMTVEDRAVVAFTAQSPLYRDLRRGDVGSDVLRLSGYLRRLGFLKTPPTRVVDAQFEEAIGTFNSRTGQEEPDAVFRLGSVVWTGPRPLLVDSVAVMTGDRISPGAEVIGGPRVLARVSVLEPAAGLPAVQGDYRLRLADTAVPYTAGSGEVTSAKSLRRLQHLLPRDGAESIASAQAAEPQPVLRVPAAAVIVDEAGRTCVLPSADAEPIRVVVAGGELGTAEIEPVGGLKSVLANPAQMLDLLTCD